MGRQLRGFALSAVAFVLLPAIVAACSFGHGSETSAASAPTQTGNVRPPPSAFARTCKTSVRGTLDSSEWRRNSIVTGPLVFYYGKQFSTQDPSLFAQLPGQEGYYAGQKLLLLVRPGTVATVAVPDSERRLAALLYNPAGWNDRNAYRIADGQSAVSFHACKRKTAQTGHPLDAMTQFNGGFVVAGARCLALDVFVPQGRAITVELPFGIRRCPT
jgi:hypothetical protein